MASSSCSVGAEIKENLEAISNDKLALVCLPFSLYKFLFFFFILKKANARLLIEAFL